MDKMPFVGFGTGSIEPVECYDAVSYALEAGYRLIDNAAYYNNEEEIGRAIKDSKIPREKLFITSKLLNGTDTFKKTIEQFELTLSKLGLEYLDLYLIHWPQAVERNAEVWRAMETIMLSGRIKKIGVSNFKIYHLEELMKTAKIKPFINQFEIHIYLQQEELVEWCLRQEINITAYGQFGDCSFAEEPILQSIAKKHDTTAFKVVLNWLHYREINVIPRTIYHQHIRENLDFLNFRLDSEDIVELSSLDNGHRYYPDPDFIDD